MAAIDLRIKRGNSNTFQLGGPVRNPITGAVYTATEPLPQLELKGADGTSYFGPADMAEVDPSEVQADGSEIGAGTYRVTIDAVTIDAIPVSRVYGFFTIGTETTIRPALPIVNRTGNGN